MKRLFIYRIALIIAMMFLTVHSSFAQETDSVAVVQEEQQTDDPPPPPQEVLDDEENNDEEKKEENYFRNRGTTDSFVVKERRLPAGYASGLKDDDDFWYADRSFNKEKEEVKESNNTEYVPLGQRSWVQTLLWIIIIGAFAAAIMYYLADSNVGLFRRRRTPAASAEDGEGEIPEDIFAINYQKEIDKAAANGDYRLAVRLMFLRLLKSLADKNIIQYKQDRTNLDYLMQLHPTKYYQSFFRLTRHFEYTWYGHFDVAGDTYNIIAHEFNQFDKEV